MTIGHAVKWTCRKDPGKYCEWIETQRLVRLKQMYPADYRWGALKGAAGSALFGGIAIRVLRGLLGLRGAAAVAAEVLASTVVGAAEAALWAANEAPPGADVRREVRETVKKGAALGFAVAFIGRGGRA